MCGRVNVQSAGRHPVEGDGSSCFSFSPCEENGLNIINMVHLIVLTASAEYVHH
jgi:hypothetical protein